MRPLSTSGATTTHDQINFRRSKSLRHFDIDFRYRFVETECLPTSLAGEMCVMPMLTRCCRFRYCPLRIHHETPHPIIAGDAMRNALIDEPFEYAVNGDAINRVVISQHCGDIQMRICRPASQQASQHRNAWASIDS